MGTAPNDGSERVKLAEKLARIDGSIDSLRSDLARYYAEAAKLHQDHEIRIRAIEQSDTRDLRIHDLEISDTRQNERLRLVTAALMILQLVGTTIAAWIGTMK